MRKKKFLKAGIVTALCLTVAGAGIACAPSGDGGGNNPPITHEMNVSIADKELDVGQREDIVVDVTNMDDEEIKCVVADSSVVMYDKTNGKLIGLKPGTTTVTFFLKNKPSISQTITITVVQTAKYSVKVGDSAPVEMSYGDKITKPQDPDDWQDERTVYEFDCWVKEGSLIEWDFDTPVTSNVTLVAKWNESARKYSVDVNGTKTDYEYNSLITKPQDPQKDPTQDTVYTFDGWYIKNSTTKWNFASDRVTADGIELEPRFIESVRKYTVTYMVDGKVYATQEYEYDESVILPSEPKKESDDEYDYEFVGWTGYTSGTKATADMEFVAEFESVQNYALVSGKVMDVSGAKLVANIYIDGQYVGKSDSNGGYAIKVKPSEQERVITAVRSGYYEMGKKFTATTTDGIEVDDIITMSSGVEGSGVELNYDKFGLVENADDDFALSVDTDGNKAVGYTFIKGLDEGTVSFTLKFGDGCGLVDGEWANALININGAIIDNNGKKIGMGITSEGTLNTVGTSTAVDMPVGKNGSVGPVLQRIQDKNYDVTYNLVYAKVNGEIALYAKSSVMDEYEFIGAYSSSDLVGELKLGFAVTIDNSTANLAFEVDSLSYGDTAYAQELYNKTRGVEYTVITYMENVDGTYSEESRATKKGIGEVSAEVESVDHYVVNEEKSILSGVAEEGLELKVYYDREVYTLTYYVEGSVYTEQEVKYGATVTAPFITPKPYYTARWDKAIDICTGNDTITAIYEQSETFALNLSIVSNTISLNGKVYDAYEFSAQDRAEMEITLLDSSTNEIAFDGRSATLEPGNYVVSVTYNGYTYTENVTVDNCDVNLTMKLTKTKLGGSVGGFSSFKNNNKTYIFADELTLSHFDYTYQDSVQGSRYYIESDISFEAKDGRTNAGLVGIMPAVRNELLSGNGAGKLIVGVTQEGKLAYTYAGGWDKACIEIADVKNKIVYDGNSYSYKLGVYRNGADFALFVNGDYIQTISVGMFTNCGFGVASIKDNDDNGITRFSDYKYSFNNELLDDLQELVHKNQISVSVTTDSDYVLDENGNKLYYQQIDSATAQRISLEIVNSAGSTIKNVISAGRNFVVNLPVGTYTVRAKYQGVNASTTKETVVTVAENNTAFAYDLPLTDLGGSYKIDNATISSSGTNYEINTADSIILKNKAYAYVNGIATDTAYIEGLFDRTTTGWYGFILNSSEGAPNDGYKKIVFAILLDNVGDAHQLFVQHSGDSWYQGTASGSIENIITNGAKTYYKMGVLRVKDYYYVFINDMLFWSGQITALDVSGNALPADNKSGFGVFCGSNCGEGARLVRDVKYTTDITVANAILNKNEYALSCDSEITVLSGSREVKNGEYIYEIEGNEKQIRVDVPQGKEILSLQVKVDGVLQNINYVSPNLYSFSLFEGNNVEIDVEFAEIRSVTDATLELGYKSASVIKDGKEYALYDITDVSASDIEVSLCNVYTGKVDTFALDSAHKNVNLNSGDYVISYKYKDNVCVKTVRINAGENQFVGEISKAYLGGAITFKNKTTSQSYTLTSFDRKTAGTTSGTNWSLIDGRRNSVHMKDYTYVIQDKVVADQIYIEGKFDLTSQTFGGRIHESMAGLLLAHGLDELSGNAGSGRDNSHKLMAGIYKESLVVNWDKEFEMTNAVVIANLEELGLLKGDRSSVKLGAVRNKNYYYFYVNDVYVGKYIWDVQTDASGVGLIGINKSVVDVYEFNYSTNKEVINALTPSKTLKDIDIYFIAGQSNASGYSKYDQDVVMALNDDYIYGFNKIWYTGNSRSGSSTAAKNRIREIGLMRAGLGSGNTTMGVEPGLAEVLSTYYNPTTGKEAGFIKYAAGGTCLLNDLSGENAPEGNWVPPSYQATLTSGVTDKTGGLYRNFIAQVTKSIADYRKLGYNPIVKGMYWMQGESDNKNPAEYLKAFKYFASDIRKDLSTICAQDCSDMPIVIGEISRTFASNSTTTLNRNKAFIEMQNTIPTHVENTYVVNSSGFDQIVKINGVDTIIGSDQYHWNYESHLKIGNLVGECIIKNILGQ